MSTDEESIRPELLTIIITTSPTPSAPHPELITSVLNSLPPSLYKLHLIITFDGYNISQSNRKRLKKGQIPQSMADAYGPYIENVKSLFNTTVSPEQFDGRMHTFISEAHNPSSMHGGRITFIRHKFRQSFGFSVKAALNYCKSENVLVMQHDWIFVPPTTPPLFDLVNIMTTEVEVNYITFITRQSVRYEYTFGSNHTRKKAVFCASRQLRTTRPYPNDLIACLHFFDRPHLCSVALYNKIFSLNVVRRGDFIEDIMGTQYLRSIVTASSDEESIQKWLTFGCWMYYPRDGTEIVIRHISGRTSLVKEEQKELVKNYIRENKLRKLKDSDGECTKTS